MQGYSWITKCIIPSQITLQIVSEKSKFKKSCNLIGGEHFDL